MGIPLDIDWDWKGPPAHLYLPSGVGRTPERACCTPCNIPEGRERARECALYPLEGIHLIHLALGGT